jgi:hypothetical protein
VSREPLRPSAAGTIDGCRTVKVSINFTGINYMKTNSLTKVVLGGAVLAGSAMAAHAQTLPNTNPTTYSSELMFYVEAIPTSGATSSYTVALTQTVGNASNSVFNSTQASQSGPVQGTTLGTIDGDAGFSYNLSGDTALTGFISTATAAGDTLEWAVLGSAVTGTTNAQIKTQGNILVVTTGTDSSVLSSSEGGLVNATTGVGPKMGADINTLNGSCPGSCTNYTTGGVTVSGSSTGVFGTTNSTYDASSNLYAEGVDQLFAINSSSTLYGLTGNGASATAGEAFGYKLGNVSFSSGDVLTFTGNSAAVPIPAAVWLFGSGLLGLLGIGRRNRQSAA